MDAGFTHGPRPAPIPAAAGIGLRHAHYDRFLAERPAVAWVEVHSENYFGAGGRPHAVLEAVRRDYPVSFHGVGLSLGSTDPLDGDHLARLAGLIERYQPAAVSEHLAWTAYGGRHFNDLLPLPYTEEALAHVAERVARAQDALGRRILIENPSTYLRFADDRIDEAAFLAELARHADCGLLVDVNNVHVNAVNHGIDARAWLDSIPGDRVGEIHLAGHTERRTEHGRLLIDTHNAPVTEAVWSLFDHALRRWGRRPALIEWDQDFPPLATLLAEAERADAAMEAHHAVAV